MLLVLEDGLDRSAAAWVLLTEAENAVAHGKTSNRAIDSVIILAGILVVLNSLLSANSSHFLLPVPSGHVDCESSQHRETDEKNEAQALVSLGFLDLAA